VSVQPELFDEDYLFFYQDVLGDERSDADAEVVARLLSLREGMRVLDVPCGEGRIAGRLARLGCEVVGVDGSELFLGLARERYPGVRFAHGDMRELSYEGEFDAVVNWFTSFGYFDTATNDAVLARFARALRPGGRLLLELHNPARLARIVELTGGVTAALVERDGNLMVDRVTYDADEGRSHTERFIVRPGSVRKLEFSLEQVPAAELEQRLRSAGFRDVELFGRDGAPFDPNGPRLIAVAQR
jgi:SAM-dependent methyltransferase